MNPTTKTGKGVRRMKDKAFWGKLVTAVITVAYLIIRVIDRQEETNESA